jgi:hypothetical protein
MHQTWLTALCGLILLLGGCCPDPRVQDAASAGDGGVSGTVRYALVQTSIFDKRCVTDCHGGANPGEGLVLTRDQSWSSLVYKRSQQVPTRFRVRPGDANGSYLMKKIEGVINYIGERMPKGAPRLSQTEIDEVRVWIGSGAPND